MNFTPEYLISLAEGFRRTLDPWVEDSTPVGPSTRVREQYTRKLSLTKEGTVFLRYVEAGVYGRSGQSPCGWELLLPSKHHGNALEDPIPLFLKGGRKKHPVQEAMQWADEHLKSGGWIFIPDTVGF